MALKRLTDEGGIGHYLVGPDRVDASEVKQVVWQGVDSSLSLKVMLEITITPGRIWTISIHIHESDEHLSAVRFGQVFQVTDQLDGIVVRASDLESANWQMVLGREMASMLVRRTSIVINMTDGQERIVLTIGGKDYKPSNEMVMKLKRKLSTIETA